LPSSPTLLPKEKGARIHVPSPFGRARVRANFAIHPAIQQYHNEGKDVIQVLYKD